MLGKYFRNVLIAIDQFFNTILAGNPDETISGRMGRWHSMGGWRAKVAKPMCWLLDLLDPDHCILCAKQEKEMEPKNGRNQLEEN